MNSKKSINHDWYLNKLPKSANIDKINFEYEKNQIYYKNNVVMGFRYRRRRVLILLVFLCFWLIPWIIPLCILFANRKPWNKFFLLNDEWVWFLEKWSFLMYPTKKQYIKKEDIDFINSNKNDNLICVYTKEKKWWYKRAFVFYDIYKFDNLIEELKKQWYKLKHEEKSKNWHRFKTNIVSIIVWSIIFIIFLWIFLIGIFHSN